MAPPQLREVAMISLTQLWLPILLSGVIVFVASAVVWMALPHHKTDWRTLPDPAPVLDALRKQSPPPGQYMLPAHGQPDLKNSEIRKQYEQGPVGIVTLRKSGLPTMGGALVQSLIFYLVVYLPRGVVQ